MDGVIADSEPFHFIAENKVFQELGIVVSEKLHHIRLVAVQPFSR
jgi:beta-phosphoglucomutase-like phosphatase (HAD superfamily)